MSSIPPTSLKTYPSIILRVNLATFKFLEVWISRPHTINSENSDFRPLKNNNKLNLKPTPRFQSRILTKIVYAIFQKYLYFNVFVKTMTSGFKNGGSQWFSLDSLEGILGGHNDNLTIKYKTSFYRQIGYCTVFGNDCRALFKIRPGLKLAWLGFSYCMQYVFSRTTVLIFHALAWKILDRTITLYQKLVLLRKKKRFFAI